ncbi:pre-B-cell leukemia transcription factor-interacting protein 1 isoform X2 [Esox lucius]|uniref:pre-B-cell leukemia transcription factor-interacting protein 1 isoform X2 n=1 Tax=Esox lucius TaxID=8010 RepID=UPI001476ADD2|nr:pre-B-cell leukemia transcription factor-interacting protein 1 isoform X2 [Esox lucius]
MSDNSSSTGSSRSSRSGSSTNSWTMLSPEEAAESMGPVDDGTESLGDVPSLSEEVAGAIVESKPYEQEIPVETVLSEEGQQVCQETEPAPSEGPVPSSPTLLSPFATSNVPLDPDPESHPEPPIIHNMVTSSPTDNEQLSNMPFVTHVNPVGPLEAHFTEPPPFEVEDELEMSPARESPTLASHVETSPAPESHTQESSAPSVEPDTSIHMKTPTPTAPPSDIGPVTESSVDLLSSSPETTVTQENLAADRPSETTGSVDKAEEPLLEKDDTELPEKETDVPEDKESPCSFDLGRADTSAEQGDGLRRRNVAPLMNTSEDEDEEEVEFKLVERKEEKRGLSINVCIVGALVLLCLGSLFLSDDSDELSEAEQKQDWLNDPQEMKEIMEKLMQENQHISQLENQLQTHEEELDSALNAGLSMGTENEKRDLEQENIELKEELSSLPGLKEELVMLRARVTELSQLTAANLDTSQPPSNPTPPSTGQMGKKNQTSATSGPERRELREEVRVKEELKRQKVLLEESKKRLEGMKKDGGHKMDGEYQKKVRESLAEIQERLSEQVERMGKRSEGKRKSWDNRTKQDGKKGKENVKDHWKKDKDWKGEKHWKHGKDKSEGGRKDSHKEAWRKKQDDWERKKDDRRMDRDKRKQERPWQSRKEYKKESNRQHQHHHQPQYDHTSFWNHQEEKLRRNVRPLAGCSGAEDCAKQEGLFPVELSEFEELLDGYLSKLERASPESKTELLKLTAQFFQDGVFVHDKILFSDFAEDVADILEDMADILEVDGQDDETLKEEMEEFEREALWKFAATV